MDLNQARQVVWIDSNRRPLGELLDSGYLTKDRLEWAVAHVNNEEVQQAASILLDWVKRSGFHPIPAEPATTTADKSILPGLELKISLGRARQVRWPFAPYKGEPMGPLVESRKLSIKDLGFAIENAWDEKVRNAAVALMAVRLGQIVREPEEPKGRLKIISKGRSYSEWKQIQYSLLQGLLYGTVFGIAVSYIYYDLFVREHKSAEEVIAPMLKTPSGIFTLVLAICIIVGILLAIVMSIEWMVKALDRQIDAYRKGQEGETKTIEVVHSAINGEWILFRDLILPGRGGDLDAVLVGPAGIWALEIKTLSGKFRNTGDQWEVLSGKKWRRMRKNPGRQARKNAGRLGGFLKADGINQWVNPAVVWANPESPLEVVNPSVAVWKLDRLEDELGNIQEGRRIADADRQKISDKLTKWVESRK
jgi:hypothetical protein